MRFRSYTPRHGANGIRVRQPTRAFVRSLQTSADSTEPIDTPTAEAPFKVKLHEDSFHTHNCEAPGLEVEVSKDRLLKMYEQMTTMRRMEMAADALYKAKLIRGFCHLAIGQVRGSRRVRPERRADLSSGSGFVGGHLCRS